MRAALRVVARHAVDFRIDRAALDLDDEVLARFADVDEFGLHEVRLQLLGGCARDEGFCERGESNPHGLTATGS